MDIEIFINDAFTNEVDFLPPTLHVEINSTLSNLIESEKELHNIYLKIRDTDPTDFDALKILTTEMKEKIASTDLASLIDPQQYIKLLQQTYCKFVVYLIDGIIHRCEKNHKIYSQCCGIFITDDSNIHSS